MIHMIIPKVAIVMEEEWSATEVRTQPVRSLASVPTEGDRFSERERVSLLTRLRVPSC